MNIGATNAITHFHCCSPSGSRKGRRPVSIAKATILKKYRQVSAVQSQDPRCPEWIPVARVLRHHQEEVLAAAVVPAAGEQGDGSDNFKLFHSEGFHVFCVGAASCIRLSPQHRIAYSD
jgi:hypothetical protein